MALVLKDRVRETSETTGTGSITLSGALAGFQSFSVIGNANTTYYGIVNAAANEWEVGIGTYTASGTVLSRDTILESSNGGTAVNFSAGTKDVFVTYPAERAVFENEAGNVDGFPITGGTIDNTVIGGTTPAAGTFTTLTSTGNATFNSGSVNFIQTSGSGASGSPFFYATGGSQAGLDFYTNGSIGFKFRTNNGVNEQARISHTASAVNFVQVTGGVTAGGIATSPTIGSQGSDTNVSLNLNGKGNGGVRIGAQRTNFITVSGSGSGGGLAIFTAEGGDTNISVVLQPKGTGALQAQQTDSTATGGNARGANAVDWQTNRGSASQVASGAQSVVTGGSNNTASQQFAVVGGGTANNASAYLSYIGGGFSNTTSRDFAAVTAGYANTAAGFYNYVGGGYNNSATSNSAVTTQSATMNGTTAVTLSGSNANIRVGQYILGTSITTLPPTFVAAISGTSLTLSQAASGSGTATLSFFTPHGVVVGGGNNQATGSYSFIGGGGDAGTAANRNVASGDWSTVGGGARNVASGIGSFVGGGGFDGSAFAGHTASGNISVVAGGLNNTAAGIGATVSGGQSNTANATFSTVVGGGVGTTRGIAGNCVIPACLFPISGTQGTHQTSILVLAVQTTDATATVLRSSAAAAGTTNQVILPNNSAYFFRGEVVSGVTGGGNTKGWTIEGVIKRGANAASTALVGTPTVTSSFADAGASTWVIAVTADTTNGGLAVTFTGQAGTTIRTVCRVNTVEMTF